MDKWVKKRGYHKGKITRVENWVDSILLSNEQLDKNELSIREKMLVDGFEHFCECQIEIETLLGEIKDDVEREDLERVHLREMEEVEGRYIKC